LRRDAVNVVYPSLILFLDGIPEMEPLSLTIGSNIREMLQLDLDLEINTVAMYNEAVKIAFESSHNGLSDLFVELLKDEEEHVDWLEAQLRQIKEAGYEGYLTMQASEKE